MRYSAFFIPTLVLAAACSDGGAPSPTAVDVPPSAVSAAPGHGQIKDAYIVVLKPGANPRGVAAAVGARPRFVYGSLINGFAATLNAAQLAALQHNPTVSWIEPDQFGRAAGTQSSAPWGLDRIDERALPMNGTYVYTGTASNVYVYILDTGIETSHPEFEGRAVNTAFDAIGGTGSGTDCHGHGTHVAGIVGGKTYGVAKKARLYGVRVMGCAPDPVPVASAVIAGLEWVMANHIAPAVVNLSFSIPPSPALDNAVDSLAHRRVFVAAAAGGYNLNACDYSPGRAVNAFTVAATNSRDERWGNSNWGTCVDMYAPGVAITSAWKGGGTMMQDGTSFAAPHVAGVAALYKAAYGNVTTNTIAQWLRANATVDAVFNGARNGTPNYLLFKATL
ncbi:MAG: hypothetical protein AVDCRST_MAG89-655 [uncultured Gemmatimonadetes bacterium]|uniref:Alkaline serine exoprotease A n=1 Tax=uncultured Gemmatimonadota bacterium TaxID=203437 RepID=A0A6J4KEF3_9BACT|nr:MAG: hypothetical protein AVDCRST_MAG89-655 [uncultured Gemmatimonadota bacterium]